MSAPAPRGARRVIVLAAALAAVGPVATAPAADAIRVVAPGIAPAALPRSLSALLGDRARIEAVPSPGDASPVAGEVLLLTPAAARWMETSDAAVWTAVTSRVRSGMGLVVWGAATAGRSASPEIDTLLSRQPMDPPAGATPPAAGATASEVVVLVPDQSHAITQCVTHLALDDAVLTPAAPSTSARELLAYTIGTGAAAPADAAPAPRPALWTARHGRGRIAVLCIDAASGDKAARAATALALLAARAIEWTAGRDVTVKIPADMPLFAERAHLTAEPAVPGPRDAIGFFRGREIAPVMGYQGADWLERRDREATEEPDRVVASLGLGAGATVADVGAGTGYFTFRLARQVGPEGRVYATDIQPEMLELLRARGRELKATNVIPVLATETDTGLPAGAIDCILMVDVYHELARPAPVVDLLRASLRAGDDRHKPGRLVLVEYRGEDPSVPIKPLHRTTVQQVRAELEPRGFKLVEVKDFLVHQHVLIFERRGAVAPGSK